MPGLGGQVHGLEHAAAFLVDDVQALHEPQVVAHFFVGARPAAAVEIAAKGGSADRGKHDAVAADMQVMRRVSCAQVESVRRQRKLFADQGRIEANDLIGVVHVGAGAAHQVAACGLEEAHPLGGQYLEGRFDDRVDVVVAENLQRRIVVADGAPRQLANLVRDSFFAVAPPRHEALFSRTSCLATSTAVAASRQ